MFIQDFGKDRSNFAVDIINIKKSQQLSSKSFSSANFKTMNIHDPNTSSIDDNTDLKKILSERIDVRDISHI